MNMPVLNTTQSSSLVKDLTKAFAISAAASFGSLAGTIIVMAITAKVLEYATDRADKKDAQIQK
jgi:hypothetical protein